MAAKSNKIHGMRLTLTVLVPFDPAKPDTITAASTTANAIAQGEKHPAGVIVEKSTIVAAAISAPAAATPNSNQASE